MISEASSPLQGLVLLAVVFALWKYLNHTDKPKIKGIPEVPGIPLFGNLLQLGDEHAKRAQELAKKYGAVFQVRLGNKVGTSVLLDAAHLLRYRTLTCASNRESSMQTRGRAFVSSGSATNLP